MTAQVIFLPPHYITREEEIRRMELQHFITGARNGMTNRIMNLPVYWQRLEKDKFHNYLRSKIAIVKYESSTNTDDEGCLVN